jgi:hypothetical protein
MIDLVTTSETSGAYRIRAWAGVATDEGVGLICLVEITDPAGRLVCRFETLLPDTVRLRNPAWPGPDRDVCQLLLDYTLERAHAAVSSSSLPHLHGRRLEIT